MASARLLLFTFKTAKTFVCFSNKSRGISTKSLTKFTNLNNGKKFRANAFDCRAGRLIWAGILTFLGLKDKDEEKQEDPMITIMKRGILCQQRGEYDKAETILHLALKVAQERQDMQAQRYIFDLLANVALEKGDFPKAEQLFLEVIKELMTSGTEKDDNSIVEISLKLASVYSEMKEDYKAVTGYSFCIETQEQKIKHLDLTNIDAMTDEDKNNLILWAMSIDFFARHLFARNYFKAAEDNFLKALPIAEKIYGLNHPQTLTIVNNLGSVAALQKDYDKAIKFFQKAISMATNSELDELSNYYCNLGATYIRKGNITDAKNACQKALKFAKKVNNKEAEEDAEECLKEVKAAKGL